MIDALALGTWAAAGAEKTLAVGLGWLPAILLGTITAVGGGAVRDVVLRRVPGILGGNTLYATCAIVDSGVLVVLATHGHPTAGLISATVVGAGLCLLARWRGWILPSADAWSATLDRPCVPPVPLPARHASSAFHRPVRIQGGTMSTQAAATVILEGLVQAHGWLEDFYRHLHQHPELSHQEEKTAASVRERLTGDGYEVTSGVGGTGVIGILRNGAGPSVLLRADMDALPVQEASGLPYASSVTALDEQGTAIPVMHACGHDVHVTALLGAAACMAAARERWTGCLIVLFQPAEEVGDGARRMVDDGLAALVGHVDVAFAQHVLPIPAGFIGTRAGPVLSAADSMRVTVRGRGAHGSMPQAAVDPVVLASMIVVRLQTVISVRSPPPSPRC